MANKVVVILSHLNNPRDQIELVIDVFDHHVADKWVLALKDLIKRKFFLKKDFMFLGFPNSPIPMDFWVDKLNLVIGKLNKYKEVGGWKRSGLPDFPYIDFIKSDSLLVKNKYNPKPLHRAHHAFELLVGQHWNRSGYDFSAPLDIKYAIIQLNDYIHQAEWRGRTIESYCINPEQVYSSTLFSFLCSPRFDLEKEDFKLFNLKSGQGKVFLKYAQLGKSDWEVFVENDQEIFPSNVNGLRQLTGQFVIDWGPTPTQNSLNMVKNEFYKWLVARGKNPKNKSLGLGRIMLGEISKGTFGNMGVSEVDALISSYMNVHKIIVSANGSEVSNTYPYTVLDVDYDQVQSSNYLVDQKKVVKIWKT